MKVLIDKRNYELKITIHNTCSNLITVLLVAFSFVLPVLTTIIFTLFVFCFVFSWDTAKDLNNHFEVKNTFNV